VVLTEVKDNSCSSIRTLPAASRTVFPLCYTMGSFLFWSLALFYFAWDYRSFRYRYAEAGRSEMWSSDL